MFRSLRHQLLGIWLLMALACAGLAMLLYGLSRQAESIQIARARQHLHDACQLIGKRYAGASASARATPANAGLEDVVLQLVLEGFDGIEGGVWHRQQGITAYAYPTYQGNSIKTDVPAAERSTIDATAQRAADTRALTDYSRASEREVLLLTACPFDTGASAWTMTRVPTAGAAFYRRLLLGLSGLLAILVLSAAVMGDVLRRWDRKLSAIEQALSNTDPNGVPDLPVTGSQELDRLASAIRRYAQRSTDARAEAEKLSRELARHERLADMGRMVATVAHEIRNPIATMRLTVENALSDAGTAEHRSLDVLLAQIQRLDGVVEGLLTMVQPIKLRVRDVSLPSWLQAIVQHAKTTLAPRAVELHPLDTNMPPWRFDPEHMERVLDNLLRNAAEHASPDTPVVLTAHISDNTLHIDVSNQGPPVPAQVREHLFEPFVSGRERGNGLGLALVREIVMAHQGDVAYEHAEGVTHFIVSLPWRAS
jgi:signal transduction histidine kinase